MKKLKQIAERIVELEQEMEKGINVSENEKKIEELMLNVSFNELFQLTEILNRKFSWLFKNFLI